MDPGNWATDLEGGARFGYALIWVLLMSNLMAVLLQTLAARLGVVTGHDLAQACRAEYSPAVNAVLWVLAEIAIAACDLAEVLGTIIALKLLFGMPLLWGCLVTAFDTFALLYLQRWGMRQMEAVILALVATIGVCFLLQIFLARPDPAAVVAGLRAEPARGGAVRRDRHPGRDGHAAQPLPPLGAGADAADRRRRGEQGDRLPLQPDRLDDRPERGVLRQRGDPGPQRRGLPPQRGRGRQHRGGAPAAALVPGHGWRRSCSAIALLCAGQSSTLTGTLAGQIVMEGYLHLRIAPWLRRLVTRLIALMPAVRGHRAGGREGRRSSCSC